MQPVKLKVPYFSQLNNLRDPYRTCNVTSIAMCLAYWGKKSKSPGIIQLEDELDEYMESADLNRYSPTDLAKVVSAYGCKDDFTDRGNIALLQKALAAGTPCVIHGYFTNAGHIVTVTGCDNDGLWVHDPYGEWFRKGYNTSANGAYLHYSYPMIERLCMDDGFLWLHRISA